MSRQILSGRRRGASTSPAVWLFPALILVAVLLPLPLFVLAWSLCFGLVVRPRDGPEDRSDFLTVVLRGPHPRGPPL